MCLSRAWKRVWHRKRGPEPARPAPTPWEAFCAQIDDVHQAEHRRWLDDPLRRELIEDFRL